MTTPSPSAQQPQENAPSPVVILVGYIILGTVISFVVGRAPGTLPEDIVLELAPALLVVCGFLTSYSVWDVMAVGVAKSRCNLLGKSYKDLLPHQLPEQVYLAQRVQTNQVEQLPVFVVGALSCALFVNGTTAAVLSFLWAVLRRCYASAYRNAAGIPLKDIGLAKYTVPAYFLSNAMLMASAVHALRALLLFKTR